VILILSPQDLESFLAYLLVYKRKKKALLADGNKACDNSNTHILTHSFNNLGSKGSIVTLKRGI
jgi:hypothetical protein